MSFPEQVWLVQSWMAWMADVGVCSPLAPSGLPSAWTDVFLFITKHLLTKIFPLGGQSQQKLGPRTQSQPLHSSGISFNCPAFNKAALLLQVYSSYSLCLSTSYKSLESSSDLWTQLKQCPQDINIVRLSLIPVAHFTSTGPY